MQKSRILVFIPTYNEKENVKTICTEILKLDLELELLFLDDNSPDGTGKVLDELSKLHSNVHVIYREGKLGIGSAHLDGINWAYEQGFSTLVTMDCDFTHKPELIHKFLQQATDCDIVVGSRFLDSNSLQEWNLIRKFLTHLGHFATKRLLKLKYDATGAFRLYKLNRIPREIFHLVTSKSYSFFFESLHILNQNRLLIKEISIELPARTYGNSKQSFKGAINSLFQLISLYLTTQTNGERLQYIDIASIEISSAKDQQGWNDYWKNQKTASSLIYNTIAAIYRKLIIRRLLNSFIRKHFSPKDQVLHAGCGSGQVDLDIRNYISITALDISPEALIFYKRVNKERCQLLHGSLFEIPKENESLDGIYNLGVFEHFYQDELHRILNEFHRILKPNGKIIIFWPPRFGLSVNVLKMVHFLLNDLFKKNIILHPNEPSLLKSRKQAEKLLNASQFVMTHYYFGIKDIFCQSVIVGKKV